MNKLFKKIAGLVLGLTMAIGVGASIGSNVDQVKAVGPGTDVMFAKGFGGYTTNSFSAAGTDYTGVANSTNKSGVTYAMQVINGSSGAVRGNKSGSGNFSCRNTTTQSDYYISQVSLTVSTGTIDGSTAGRSSVYFGSSVFSNPNVSAPSGTETRPSPSSSEQSTLTWTNTDKNCNYFILYNLKTSGTALSANATNSLKVTWVAKTTSYTVSYDANGGSGSHVDDTYSGTPITLPSEGFSKEHYTFDGWATSPTGAKAYDKGASYTPSGNVTLYAHYTVSEYVVSYHAGSGSGSHENDVVTKGQSVTLPDSGFSKEHYTFDGWSTSSGGDKAYDKGAIYTPSADITLYAHYTILTFTITPTYIKCEGSIESGETIQYGGTLFDYIEPTEGYHLPSQVAVSVNGEAEPRMVSINSDGELETTNITGDVTYTVEAIINSYEVSGNIANGTLTNTGSINHGTPFSGTINPTAEYHLPDNITVTIDGVSTSNFTYNPETGSVEIAGEYVTGDIEITGTCYRVYAINPSCVGGSVNTEISDTNIKNGETAKIYFVNSSGYILPPDSSEEYFEVVNADIKDYNPSTGCLTIENPTGPVSIVCSCVQIAYKNITLVMDNVTSTGTGDEKIKIGEGATVTITANTGYRLPSEDGFSVTGADASFSYSDDYNVTITLSNCIDDVIITGTCVQQFEVSVSVTNGTATKYSDVLDSGSSFSTMLSANSGYKLPDTISVTIGGQEAQVGTDYTYNSSTGAINVTSITGTTLISAAMVALSNYDVFVTTTNVTKVSGPDTIQERGTATYVFSAESSAGYYLPDSVTVVNAGYTWTKSTGTLVISNPTGDVSIAVVADKDELTNITLSPSSGTYTLGDEFVMPAVTAHYKYKTDENVTDSAVYSGFDPFTTGTQTVTISYTEDEVEKTADYTATVNAAQVKTVTTWEKSELSNLTSEDVFVIVGKKNDAADWYAMGNTGGTTSAPAASAVTISNQKITSSVSDSIMWKLSKNGNNYTFYPNDNADTWLYCTSSNNGVRVGTNTNKIFTWDSTNYLKHDSTSRFVGIYYESGSAKDWRCYTGNTGTSNIANQSFGFYKKVEKQEGSANLIRITGEYVGEDKYIGDKVSTSDFLVKKQLDTGDDLFQITDFTINGGTEVTLTGTSNTITISYTENSITKTCDVVVTAEERTAEVVSVKLIQGANVKKKYIDYPDASWDYTDLTVECKWTDSTYDETFDLADLVESGDATISPSKPSEGVTSFTVSYTYYEKPITDSTVSGITVIEDYVTAISWTGTSAAQFKKFSGDYLTEEIVNSWVVVPTFAGAGIGGTLSFNDYTLKVGEKTISSLPYEWKTEDDGQALTITYGLKEDGTPFVKSNSTAKGNICAKIDAIDHDVIIKPGYDEEIKKYIKITDTSDIENGKYLITYENTQVSFDGSLDNSSNPIDANLNRVSTTISDATIEKPENDNFYVNISGSSGNYSIKTASGYYIGSTSYNNELKTSSSQAYANDITFDSNGNAVITSNLSGTNHTTLRYNKASNTERFRYYKSGQEAIALYKYVETTIHHDPVIETTHYANQIEHFDAQKAVVEFAKYVNTTMNSENVCSGTKENLGTAWTAISSKYTELFGPESSLSSTELAWAKNMLKYVITNDVLWKSNEEMACVEKAMSTYVFCVKHYSDTCNPFMKDVRPVEALHTTSLLNVMSENPSVVIISVIALVGASSIGGYFYIRRRKENQ